MGDYLRNATDDELDWLAERNSEAMADDMDEADGDGQADGGSESLSALALLAVMLVPVCIVLAWLGGAA